MQVPQASKGPPGRRNTYEDVQGMEFEEEDGRYEFLRPMRYDGPSRTWGKEAEEAEEAEEATFSPDSLTRISQVASMINKMDFTLGSTQSQPLPIFSTGEQRTPAPLLPSPRLLSRRAVPFPLAVNSASSASFTLTSSLSLLWFGLED